MNMSRTQITRRSFLAGTAAAVAAGCATTKKGKAPAKIGARSPNEKLNIAGIGVGGKGQEDIWNCKDENVVALCDVDWNYSAKLFSRFPDAVKYKNFREMFDKQKDIDAVTISTPDHMHAYIAYAAM